MTTVSLGAAPGERPSRLVNVALALWAISALISFIVTLIQSISNVGVVYDYGTPLTASFISLVSLLLIVFFTVWANLMYAGMTAFGVWFWLITGLSWSLFGFMTMVSLATLPGESLAAGLSFLFWMLPGALIAVQSYQLRQNTEANNKKCCDGAKSHISGCVLTVCMAPVLLFVLVCMAAIWVQSMISAADYATFKPLGSIYTITAQVGPPSNTVHLRMHMACYGPKQTSNTTWIFEHGGGSNSNSLKYLADRIAVAGYRACVYDRLGYGWTPSMVTREFSNPARATFEPDHSLLSKLLSAAGETGPYICVGHSAGAEKCLRFAAFSNHSVKAIAYLDGYPDFVRAGSTAGGGVFTPNDALIGTLKLFAFLSGPTGFTRGTVGRTTPEYVPKEQAAANMAMYAQTRFWFSQLWDVVADMSAGVDGYAYSKLGGSQDTTTGLVTYGKSLDLVIGVYPAASTVLPLDCAQTPRDYCCGDAKSTSDCIKAGKNRAAYDQQARLYANSTAIQPGIFQVAPVGSEHGCPYSSPYAEWLVQTLLSNLTSTP